MFSIIGWIIIGALAGWLAGMIMGDRGGQNSLITNIVLGLIGAVIGGFVVGLINPDFNMSGNSWWISLPVAVLGAVIAIAIYRAVAGRNAV